MTDNKFEARTDHILYIVANARYDCYRGDSDCFNKTIDILNSKIHDLSLRGAYYLPEYIAGMYPEFDEAERKAIQERRTADKKVLTELRDGFYKNSIQEILEILSYARPHAKALISLTTSLLL